MLRKTNSFTDILLQENPSNVLRQSFEGGRIAQTYLFAGKASVGRMTVAKAFVALLQCQKPVRDEKGFLDSCGQCENCRRILNNSHPDVKYITPNGNEIKIEQIRELQDSAVLKPTLGAWQIYIVDPAEKLNVSSSNALLKTLEEAPAHSLFILLASDTGAVLPTVLSRSEIVRFNAPSHQQAREILQNKFKMSPEAAASCYSLSEGNFGQSLNMAEDFEYDPEIVGIKRAHGAEITTIGTQAELRAAIATDNISKGKGTLFGNIGHTISPFYPRERQRQFIDCRHINARAGIILRELLDIAVVTHIVAF